MHLSDDDVARLVASGDRPGRSVVEHLARCPHCLALVREQWSLRAEVTRHAGTLPDEWLEAALAVGRAGAPVATRPRSRAAGLTLKIAVAGAAALVLVLGGARLLDEMELRRGRDVIARQLRHDSSGGLIYAPDLIPVSRGVRGNGGDSELDRALTRLVALHDAGSWTPDQAYWLVAGYLGRSDLDNAAAFLREAVRSFPEDRRFLTLAGILAYKRDELGLARDRFEEALRAERNPATLYNLALVQMAAGDSAGGARRMGDLRREFPDSPIAALPGATTP